MEHRPLEEVDDLDPVPRRLESPAELWPRAIAARAHGRGDNEDAPAHDGDYRPAGMAAVLLALGGPSPAAASVLQQREAQRHGSGRARNRRRGVRLVLRLARRPVWLAGLAADGLGYGLQALALGSVSPRGQPVITSGILFAPPQRGGRRRLGRAEFAWACILAIGLTVFVFLAGTDGGRDFASTRAWLACGAIATPVLLACIVVASRSVGTRRAVLFAFTAGAVFGLTAALTKSTVVLLDHHGFGALEHWEPYALIVLGASGFVVNQRAFQAGSLTASLPTLTVVGLSSRHRRRHHAARRRRPRRVGVAGGRFSVVAMVVATVVPPDRQPATMSSHEHSSPMS